MTFPHLPATMPDREAEDRWEGEGGAMLPFPRPWVVRRMLQMKFYEELITYIKGDEFIRNVFGNIGSMSGGVMHTGKGGGVVTPGMYSTGGTVTGRWKGRDPYPEVAKVPRQGETVVNINIDPGAMKSVNYSAIEKRIAAHMTGPPRWNDKPRTALEQAFAEDAETERKLLKLAGEIAESSQISERTILMQLRQVMSKGTLKASDLQKSFGWPWWRRALSWVCNVWRR